MPLLSSDSGRLVVAIDELGYGQSDNPVRSCTLEEIADGALCVADSLGIDKFVVVGSLMGCYFSLSLAARYHHRVCGVVCTNLYYFPKGKRDQARAVEKQRKERAAATAPICDSWELKDDGSHIAKLFEQRAKWLDPVMNTRAVSDELCYLIKRRERYARAVYIQDGAAFDLEGAAQQVTCPMLCVRGADATSFFDLIGFDMTGQFAEAMTCFEREPEVATIEKQSSINIINQNPEEWSAVVLDFLGRIDENSG
jgi:pimeloyl-ACP methyl ester carboxylesterase